MTDLRCILHSRLDLRTFPAGVTPPHDWLPDHPLLRLRSDPLAGYTSADPLTAHPYLRLLAADLRRPSGDPARLSPSLRFRLKDRGARLREQVTAYPDLLPLFRAHAAELRDACRPPRGSLIRYCVSDPWLLANMDIAFEKKVAKALRKAARRPPPYPLPSPAPLLPPPSARVAREQRLQALNVERRARGLRPLPTLTFREQMLRYLRRCEARGVAPIDVSSMRIGVLVDGVWQHLPAYWPHPSGRGAPRYGMADMTRARHPARRCSGCAQCVRPSTPPAAVERDPDLPPGKHRGDSRRGDGGHA